MPVAIVARTNGATLATSWILRMREKLEAWRRDYNEVRPHNAIGYNVPINLYNPGGATSTPP